MTFIGRKYLGIVRDESERESVSRDELLRVLRERPGNVVYFETPRGLYGIVTSGDVYRAGGERVAIHKAFTSVSRSQVMTARETFRSRPNIQEIPVVEDGILAGEYINADDELLLDRAVPWERNAYTGPFFSRLKGLALVEPAAAREYKRPYFERMKRTLDAWHVEYAQVTFSEMLERVDEFDTFLLADYPEKRGAVLALYLRWGKDLAGKTMSYYNLREKLESSGVMDYRSVFQRFREMGVEIVLLTAQRAKTEYLNRVRAQMRKRFPVENPPDLNSRARLFADSFFDDVMGMDRYAESILRTSYIVSQRDQDTRLRDMKSRYVNIRHGERVTVDQPETFERTVYFFGPCLVIGNFVCDDFTVESWLQKMLNANGYRVRVVNCGCWGGNETTLNRMAATAYKKGDIIVALMEDMDSGVEGIPSVNLWDAVEKYRIPAEWMLDNPCHVNHHVTEVYAREIFARIRPIVSVPADEKREYAPCDLDLVNRFFTEKYFHGVDLTGYKTAACCVVNGNPFTEGHRYLIETAARETEKVYLLILRENASVFSYGERYAMAVDALKDLKNVTVVPSGMLICNITNFPVYYAKADTGDAAQQCRSEVRMYAQAASQLHATHRYLGEEPQDPITDELNRACREILPQWNIQTVILPRKQVNGMPVSGTFVRGLAETNPDALREYVPGASADIILCRGANAFE